MDGWTDGLMDSHAPLPLTSRRCQRRRRRRAAPPPLTDCELSSERSVRLNNAGHSNTMSFKESTAVLSRQSDNVVNITAFNGRAGSGAIYIRESKFRSTMGSSASILKTTARFGVE